MTDLRIRTHVAPPGAPSDPTVGARTGASPPVPPDGPSTYRPRSRRRRRIAAGVALAAAAIAGNVFVYAGLDRAEPVVQVVRDIPAGEQLTPDALRAVDVELDDSVPAIPAEDVDGVVGRYAKVRLVAGSLVTPSSLQSEPLVAAGRSVVAVRVPDGSLPIGLRERSPIDLVLPASAAVTPAVPPDAPAPVTVVPGRMVGLPSTPGAQGASLAGTGTTSLSVEVAAADAATVAAADEVRIVLVEPRPDEALADDTSSHTSGAPTDTATGQEPS